MTILIHFLQLNPHWGDERLFQEGRRIMGAMNQHITYNEFLPRIIGLNAMNLYDLRVRTEGYSTDYDPTCNPSIFNEFATAAFRYKDKLNNSIKTLLVFKIWPFLNPPHAHPDVR